MLNPANIRNQVGQLLTDTNDSKISVEQANEKFINGLTDIIINAIKSATVKVDPGIPVSTSGGAGTTTGPGTGSLS
jgi:hypothetical protein